MVIRQVERQRQDRARSSQELALYGGRQVGSRRQNPPRDAICFLVQLGGWACSSQVTLNPMGLPTGSNPQPLLSVPSQLSDARSDCALPAHTPAMAPPFPPSLELSFRGPAYRSEPSPLPESALRPHSSRDGVLSQTKANLLVSSSA